MSAPRINRDTRYWTAGFLAALALVFAYVAQRHAGTYPAVFADEQIYSRLARLVPLTQATIPSYLYFWLYRLTNALGDGFLDGVRYLNLLFFVGAAPFIYLSARTVSPRPAAMMVALACVLAPAKIYTAYFMPESMYFFGFAVLTWLALARRDLHWAKYALAAGAVLGLMMLVKVHALFLLPALCAFMLYAGWRQHRQGPWLRIGLASACLAAGAALALKFSLGYLFGGEGGLHLLGPLYGNQAGGSLGALDKLLKLLPAALISLKGHAMMLAIMFALPLAAIVHFALSRGAREDAGNGVEALIAYTVLMLGAALALAVFYTASIAGFGPQEGVRLHVRYYNFTFPLLLMVAAARIGSGWRASWAALPWAIAAVLAAVLVHAPSVLVNEYRLLMADAPEIVSLGLDAPGSFAALVIGLEIALLALWAASRSLAASAFLFVFLPICVFNAETVATSFLALAHNPSPYDTAGKFTHDYLSPAERNKVTVAGTNLGELLRAKFHIDAPDVELMDLPPGWALQPYQLPGRNSWLLVVGDHALPPGVTPVVKKDGFALVQTHADNKPLGSVAMSGPLEGDLLTGADGLAGAEPWGRWSNARQVRLHFRAPLPRQLNLFLTVQAFGPNEGQEFKVRAGRAEAGFRIPGMPQEIHLQLQTEAGERTVTIDVPQPVSPKSLGMSGDTRELGLGITKLEIGTPAAP